MWWLFRPKHTVDSVIAALVEGVENGTVVLPQPEEEPATAAEASVAVPYSTAGPFRSYLGDPFGTIPQARRKRDSGEAVRKEWELVAAGYPV